MISLVLQTNPSGTLALTMFSANKKLVIESVHLEALAYELATFLQTLDIELRFSGLEDVFSLSQRQYLLMHHISRPKEGPEWKPFLHMHRSLDEEGHVHLSLTPQYGKGITLCENTRMNGSWDLPHLAQHLWILLMELQIPVKLEYPG